MSNARNLANILGTSTTIQTAKLAANAVTSAKIAADAVTSPKISESSVLFGQSIDSGSITSDTGTLDIALDSNYKHYRMYFRNFWVNNGKTVRIYKLSAANTTVDGGCYGGATYQGEGLASTQQYSDNDWYPLLGGTGTLQQSSSGAYPLNGVMNIGVYSSNRLSFTFHGIARIISGQTVNLNTGCINIETSSPYGFRIQCDDNGSGEKIKKLDYSVWAEAV